MNFFLFIFSFISISCIAAGDTLSSSSTNTTQKIFRIIPYYGRINAYANENDFVIDDRDDISRAQTGLASEYLFSLNEASIGLGVGISYRDLRDWNYSSNKISSKFYITADILDNRKHLISFNFQGGFMQAFLTNNYLFYGGTGLIINPKDQSDKINICIYPFIEYHTGESIEKTYYSHIYYPGHPTPMYTRKLTYTNLSYNFSIFIQFISAK